MEFLLQLIAELFSGTGAVQNETAAPTDLLRKEVVKTEVDCDMTIDESQREGFLGENIIFNFIHFH